MIKALLIRLIKLYQLVLSPIMGGQCRFYPSCSNYALDAINEYGAFKGSLLAIWRIIRCNPFCKGGYDPVKPKNIKEEK